jgi:hypothetical protein
MTLSRDTAKNDGFWLEQFGQRLKDMNGQEVKGVNSAVWRDIINAWNTSQAKNVEEKLKEIFDGQPNRIRAYAEFFGL